MTACNVRPSALAQLLFVLFLCAAGSAECADVPSPCAKEDDTCRPLSILSWNVHGLPFPLQHNAARARDVAAIIVQRQPDIVLLQEVWGRRFAQRIRKALEGRYEPVGKACGEAAPCFLLFRGGGLMALRRVASDWQIQGPPQFTRFHESAPSRRVLEGDGMSRKGYHTFVVVDGTTNRSTRIYNTHLQSQYEEKGREYFTIRARQSEQILLAIEPDASVIVAGDFNTAPLGLDRQIYDVLAQALQDGTAAFREMCPTCGTHFAAPDHNGLRDPNGSWIDYTFYSSADGDDLTLAAFDRLTLQVYDAPSDHHGLHTMFLVDGPAQDTPASN